jgi:3-methyladenine DNA glycosylase AlkD
VNVDQILDQLRTLGSEHNLAGMARFGINTDRAFGVSLAELRPLARALGKDHDLALALWATGYREARLLAALVDRPQWVTEAQMDQWVGDFDSWDVCDTVCGKLLDKTPFAYAGAMQYATDEREFVKRAGYALMAWLAVHDKQRDDAPFEKFLVIIVAGADDERNFVKKAVNWALRQIGKRNATLRVQALTTAETLLATSSPSARWVARDALRELRGK